MTCPNCGAISASEHAICPNCATPITHLSSSTTSSTTSSNAIAIAEPRTEAHPNLDPELRPGTVVATQVSQVKPAMPATPASAAHVSLAARPSRYDTLETPRRGAVQEAVTTSASPVSPPEHAPGAPGAPIPTHATSAPAQRTDERDGPAGPDFARDGTQGDTRATTASSDAHPDAAEARPAPTPWRPRRTVSGLIALAVLAALVAMLLPGAQRVQPTQAHEQPTATTQPTATATPLPTPLPGFALYVDNKSGFMIQYPDTWGKENLVPSIQFYDNAQSTYVVTVLPADPSSGPANTDATAAAMNWVNLTLNGIQQEESVQNFQRITGPTPALHAGGQVWQSGVATFGPDTAPNRVQVYATVYDGKPFVITLVAPDDLFENGQEHYFEPMLATFQFLPPNI